MILQSKTRTRDTLYFIFMWFYILSFYTFEISLKMTSFRRNMLPEQVTNNEKLFWMVVPCIWFQLRVNYQLDANICLF